MSRYTMLHLTGLCLKPLYHGEYQTNHQQCQQVSTECKSTCPNQISEQELNTLIQWVHRKQWQHRCLTIAFSLTWTLFGSGKCLINAALLWKLVFLIFTKCPTGIRQKKRYSKTLLVNSILHAQSGICQLYVRLLPVDPVFLCIFTWWALKRN